MNPLEQLAANLAKQGAPVLGGLIGTAIGGPAGTLVGSLAGKAIEGLADTLGTEPTPAAVNAAIESDPGAAAKIQATEARAGEMVKVWETEAKAAAEAQAAEISQGFGSWNARRNVAHYSAWLCFDVSVVALIAGVFTANPQLTILSALVGTTAGIVIAWTTTNSGGKAITDAVKAWKGQ
jgi:hypothetical protein